ncbi:c-type cytochrome [Candidatus Thioglobus autotrophicus]|jgi:cytochrome c553|uniref:c-type cytochrome n=1 Tax=Candidatus Thioglobus autotrophicus TaxID=1705394 RepID=UPI00299F190F|nr:c-type cytochrome [Candidatus Thioglobus autotrophicus]WPE16723.1 cytochrome C [Candidatus Thioglobus autotrophicus]WPE18282.1 cytochrome C [Candidatus Thioglobus autotrophicus]
MRKVLLVASAVLAMGSVQANPFDALGCSGCHGAGGKSAIPTYPSLAKSARPDLDVVKELKAFQSGTRVDPTMNAMAPMAAGQEQAIADYLAGQ